MHLFPNKQKLLILAALLVAFGLQAQDPVAVERSSNKIILEGKVYYVHVVEPGQTLYSIAHAYNVSEKDITLENPGAMSGIRAGQTLKIPVESTVAKQVDTSSRDKAAKGKSTHRVKRGETFYSIARSYGLSETQLMEANPGIDPQTLRPGMRLVVPRVKAEETPDEAASPSFNEEGYIYHKVKRRETLASIAIYYGVEEKDARKANPELGWGIPRNGQVIRIPKPEAVKMPEGGPDTLIYDSSADADTLEAYNYSELSERHDNPRRTYRVAYLVPFNFQEAEPLDSLLKDIESIGKRNRIIERYRQEEKEPQSIPFLEFFQGSLMALDSMQGFGMKLDVHFYDTRRSVERTREILEEPWMEDMDLIIGPFYSFNLELVSDFAKQNRIPLVTPFYNDATYTWDNPYLFQVSPSIEAEYTEMARLVASKHDYNIVYVREPDTLDTEKHGLLKEKIFDGFDYYRPENPVIFKEMVLTLEQGDEIIHSLSSDRPNLVIVPTRNEALASRVVNALYYRLNDFEIEILGSSYWTEYSSISYRFYHKLNLMFCSPFWLDLLNPGVDRFMRNYRNQFYAEPMSMSRKGINYGIAGFDMTLYFVNALREFGPRFILRMDDYNPRLVLDTYGFTRTTPAGGYENNNINFHRFTPEMSIVPLKVPEYPVYEPLFRPMEREDKPYLNYHLD